jgi:anti-sigma28 factor (negative regulator of flagellin synthesis)
VKINEHNVLNITKPKSDTLFEVPKPSTGSAYGSPSTAPASDGIDLKSQSGLVSQALASGTTDRANRVEQLRALYQSGQYQVDSTALSQSIVGAALNGY